MAGMNNMIPYICPELPGAQKAALHQQVRTINVEINVLFRDWKAFERMKVNSFSVPKSFINGISLQTPRTFGAMQASLKPEQPCLARFNGGNGISNEAFYEQLIGAPSPVGMNMRDQNKLARNGLYKTPYETFEREIRSTAARALSDGGFDPARDIAAITVNRWGHGYCLPDNTLFDPADGPRSWETGRRKFGHITIANSDASGVDNAQTAIDEAARAVRELEHRMYGYYGLI
jgi:spermidine dehydrogenase